MNKNVFDYLNGKAHDVADYIKAKAEAAGNYISDHAQDIKNGAIKTTATLLTAAALVTGMTACDTTPSNDPQSSQQSGEVETKNITSQDVLDVYDNIGLLYTKDRFVDQANTATAQFDNINVNTTKTVVSGKFQMADEPFYYTNNNDLYTITYNYKATVYNETRSSMKQIQLNKEDFENLMKAFNIEPITITEDYWKQNPTFANSHKNLTGATVYPAFKFTRETIDNANKKQLTALYNIGTEIFNQAEKEIQDKEITN